MRAASPRTEVDSRDAQELWRSGERRKRKHACSLEGPSGCGVMMIRRCSRTYCFETGESRPMRKVFVSRNSRQQERTRLSTDAEVQYQNELVETTMIEVEWDASSSMGVVAEEVGVGGCTGQQLQSAGQDQVDQPLAQDIALWMGDGIQGRDEGFQTRNMQMGRSNSGSRPMILLCCRYVQSTVPELVCRTS